jgi:hypothetical protein
MVAIQDASSRSLLQQFGFRLLIHSAILDAQQKLRQHPHAM